MFKPKESLLSKLKEDLRMLIDKEPSRMDMFRAVLLKREFHIMMIYRLSHFFYNLKLSYLATVMQRINIMFYGVEISFKINIGSGFRINHGVGTVIGDAVIHTSVTVFQNVTIGANYPELTSSNKPKGYPTIEERVVIFPGAVIVGPITIGKNSVIGANAVIVSNIPPESVIAAPKAVEIGSSAISDMTNSVALMSQVAQ
ncbi:serine O-acetyltransferase [Cohnella herbarum]|uniref:Serine acetyltransferase n=1 Tax=Cohnella herbarum TaxID=2728023 RepID=A0A7Z2ZPB7_9BACL|nr:hypothetical protein [Cohnella herbarum]QJD87203.1 hypothetical protein HH215_31185 [Cohnella herbarum]